MENEKSLNFDSIYDTIADNLFGELMDQETRQRAGDLFKELAPGDYELSIDFNHNTNSIEFSVYFRDNEEYIEWQMRHG